MMAVAGPAGSGRLTGRYRRRRAGDRRPGGDWRRAVADGECVVASQVIADRAVIG